MNLLAIAENEAPWGEAATNMRMEYIASMMQASSDGYEVEARKKAQSFAFSIWSKLMSFRHKKGKIHGRR